MKTQTTKLKYKIAWFALNELIKLEKKTVESHSEKQDTKLQILFYKLVNDDLKNESWFQQTTHIAYI